MFLRHFEALLSANLSIDIFNVTLKISQSKRNVNIFNNTKDLFHSSCNITSFMFSLPRTSNKRTPT